MVLFKNVVKLSSQENIGTSPLGPALKCIMSICSFWNLWNQGVGHIQSIICKQKILKWHSVIQSCTLFSMSTQTFYIICQGVGHILEHHYVHRKWQTYHSVKCSEQPSRQLTVHWQPTMLKIHRSFTPPESQNCHMGSSEGGQILSACDFRIFTAPLP